MKSLRISLLLIAVILLALSARTPNSTRARADETAAPPTAGNQTAEAPTAQPDPPGTIDGAKNPELIPDEVAYRMLFLGIAEPEDATEPQKARARGKIASAGLSEDDTEAFLRLLAEFHKGWANIDDQVAQIWARNPFPHPLSTDYAQLLGLGKQREDLVANTIFAIPAKLTLEGANKLDAFAKEQKRGMKRIPMADMPPAP